jgi:uncharacterized protein YceH (UPF0502 family)
MTLALNDIELRVLGVLIEKSHTTPDAYPLTINAIVSGCNQKQNRDPVMSVTDGEVARSLQTLEHKGLAHQAPPEPGARANRFKHTVADALHWDKRQQAVVAELMLRGRQTAGELRSRASRMASLPDLPAVLHVLGELADHKPPFVEELPREAGRSANRFRHLIGVTGPLDEAAPASAPMQTDTTVATAGTPHPSDDSLANRLTALETRVAALEARLDAAQIPTDSTRHGDTHPV